MNIDELVAIDIHTHAEKSCRAPLPEEALEMEAAKAKYFKNDLGQPAIPDIAAYYRARKMACVIFPVDAECCTGLPRVPNDEVAELVAQNRDVMIPFASIDPARGKTGVREAIRLIEQFGVRGFKFHPTMQGFDPNDRKAYPLYEVIAHYKLPALFHTGQTGIGAGMPGGAGLRLKHSNPMLIDDVAADFPDMPIILAHPSFPWQEEALAVATHKPQVHIDLSGWSPKYFPPILVQYANTLLKHKMLFGSDFPLITPDRWIADFDKLPIKDEVRRLILKDNAARLLGLKKD